MDVYSWFRRSLSGPEKTNKPSAADGQGKKEEVRRDEEEEIFGVTRQLIDFIKTFTLETFKNFSLQDEDVVSSGDGTPASTGNVRKDLSEWQERHATFVLSKVKVTIDDNALLSCGRCRENNVQFLWLSDMYFHVPRFSTMKHG
ncbi:hypothetical protein U1Q18_033842 [Sarracenia purpurea var. burkii]